MSNSKPTDSSEEKNKKASVDALARLVEGEVPKEKVFHDEKIEVYECYIPISHVTFWKENARTLLQFEILKDQMDKSLDEMTEDEVVKFLKNEPKLKLATLKKSVKTNGVKVPIIVTDQGELLDGNRRFFACKLLQKDDPDHWALSKIPAYIVREDSLTEILKKKILAEANFVDDCKQSWPLDVKAKVVGEHFDALLKNGLDEESAMNELVSVYGIKRQDAKDYIRTKKLADKFISEAPSKENEFARRKIIQNKFVYFWEFVNKALKGRHPLKDDVEEGETKSEYEKVEYVFFDAILNGRLKNMKHVEPLTKSVRHTECWSLVKSGEPLSSVALLYQELISVRQSEDRVRRFRSWLLDSKKEDWSPKMLYELEKLHESISNILSSSGRDGDNE